MFYSLYHLQTVVTLLDVSVGSRPWRYGHMYVAVSYGIVYLLFQVIYVAAFDGTDQYGNDYVYGIFKWKTEPLKATGYVAMMIVVLILAHTFLWLLSIIRDKLWERWFAREQDEVVILGKSESNAGNVNYGLSDTGPNGSWDYGLSDT